MPIGDRLRRRRQELRLSQQELSDRAGVRRATIADIERGTRGNMTVETAKKLARALGVSIDYLAGTWESEDSEQ